MVRADLADGLIHLSMEGSSHDEIQRRIRIMKLRTVNHRLGSFSLIPKGDGNFDAIAPLGD